MVGFVGFACSFAGKFFGGYARGANRNWTLETKNNLLKQMPRLENVVFECLSYIDLSVPYNSFLYLDPPYRNTTKYKSKFDNDKFESWCLDLALGGH